VVVEPAGKLVDVQHGQARRRQLNRQWNAVEVLANAGDGECILLGYRERRYEQACPVDK
jgi:hypothetical protein